MNLPHHDKPRPTRAASSKLRVRFGDVVRAKRRGMGWSQEDLADAAQLHRTYIGAVERGERNISLRTIARLAAALKVSVSELLEGL